MTGVIVGEPVAVCDLSKVPVHNISKVVSGDIVSYISDTVLLYRWRRINRMARDKGVDKIWPRVLNFF